MANILVIDDDEDICDLLQIVLTADGHQVALAEDGEKGIELYRKKKFDLIITDILMPNKDGINVIVDIINGGNRVPIIAISGGRRAISSDFNLQSAELLGVTATLKKPFTASEMRRTIKKILG